MQDRIVRMGVGLAAPDMHNVTKEVDNPFSFVGVFFIHVDKLDYLCVKRC